MMKDALGIIKEAPALVVALQNNPAVLVALVAVCAFVLVALVVRTLGKKP